MPEYDSNMAAPAARAMQKRAQKLGWTARTDYVPGSTMSGQASTLLRLQRGRDKAVGIWWQTRPGAKWTAHKAYTWVKGEVEADRIGIKELGQWIKDSHG